MNRLLILFCLCVAMFATASVVDATVQNDATIISGVRVEKEATTSKNYVYWSFANSNTYPVEVTYSVANYPSGSVVLGVGQKKRSYTAYHEGLECKVVVKRVSADKIEDKRNAMPNTRVAPIVE